MRLVRLALCLVALVVQPAIAQDAAQSRIVVVGEARVEAVPDIGRFTAGVETEATRAADAFSATNAAMQVVFGALQASGIASEDIQTSDLGVDPLWTEGTGQPRVRGYVARNHVTVRVRDIARLGAVIDAVGVAGANRFFGIGFELSEPRDRLDAARRAAVADAQAKAKLLAEAAGVTLGPVLSIREGGGGGGPVPLFARAAEAMPAPVAEGTVALEARVEIVYAIN